LFDHVLGRSWGDQDEALEEDLDEDLDVDLPDEDGTDEDGPADADASVSAEEARRRAEADAELRRVLKELIGRHIPESLRVRGRRRLPVVADPARHDEDGEPVPG